MYTAGAPAANGHGSPAAQRRSSPLDAAMPAAAAAAAAAPSLAATRQQEGEEGPGTETDSDDDLRPYDLSEGEDEGAFHCTAKVILPGQEGQSRDMVQRHSFSKIRLHYAAAEATGAPLLNPAGRGQCDEQRRRRQLSCDSCVMMLLRL